MPLVESTTSLISVTLETSKLQDTRGDLSFGGLKAMVKQLRSLAAVSKSSLFDTTTSEQGSIPCLARISLMQLRHADTEASREGVERFGADPPPNKLPNKLVDDFCSFSHGA